MGEYNTWVSGEGRFVRDFNETDKYRNVMPRYDRSGNIAGAYIGLPTAALAGENAGGSATHALPTFSPEAGRVTSPATTAAPTERYGGGVGGGVPSNGFNMMDFIQNYRSPSSSFEQTIRDMYDGMRGGAQAASDSRLTAIAEAAGVRGGEITSAMDAATGKLSALELDRRSQIAAVNQRQAQRQEQALVAQAVRERDLAEVAASQQGGGRPEIAAVQALMSGQVASQNASASDAMSRLTAVGEQAAAERSSALAGTGVEARDALAGDVMSQETAVAAQLEALLAQIMQGESNALFGEKQYVRQREQADADWRRNAMVAQMSRQQAAASAASRAAAAEDARTQEMGRQNAAIWGIDPALDGLDWANMGAPAMQFALNSIFNPPQASPAASDVAAYEAASNPTVQGIINQMSSGSFDPNEWYDQPELVAQANLVLDERARAAAAQQAD